MGRPDDEELDNVEPEIGLRPDHEAGALQILTGLPVDVGAHHADHQEIGGPHRGSEECPMREHVLEE